MGSAVSAEHLRAQRRWDGARPGKGVRGADGPAQLQHCLGMPLGSHVLMPELQSGVFKPWEGQTCAHGRSSGLLFLCSGRLCLNYRLRPTKSNDPVKLSPDPIGLSLSPCPGPFCHGTAGLPGERNTHRSAVLCRPGTQNTELIHTEKKKAKPADSERPTQVCSLRRHQGTYLGRSSRLEKPEEIPRGPGTSGGVREGPRGLSFSWFGPCSQGLVLLRRSFPGHAGTRGQGVAGSPHPGEWGVAKTRKMMAKAATWQRSWLHQWT